MSRRRPPEDLLHGLLRFPATQDHLSDEEIRALLRRHLPEDDPAEPSAAEVRGWIQDGCADLPLDDLLTVYALVDLLDRPAHRPAEPIEIEEAVVDALRLIVRRMQATRVREAEPYNDR